MVGTSNQSVPGMAAIDMMTMGHHGKCSRSCKGSGSANYPGGLEKGPPATAKHNITSRQCKRQ